VRSALKWTVPIAALLVLLVVSGGCASPGSPGQQAERSTLLAQELTGLDASVDAGEANRLAAAAVEQAALLSREFRPARPAWFNNVLVNAGLRRRGLCYHWANELFVRLHKTESRTLELHLAVANLDTPREHNSVVVTARGQPFENGVVLDGWRYGGRLYFAHIDQDTRYAWRPLPRFAMRPDIRELVDRQPKVPSSAVTK